MFCSEVPIRDTHESPTNCLRDADMTRGVLQTWKDTESDANIRLVRNATFFEPNFHLHFHLKSHGAVFS